MSHGSWGGRERGSSRLHLREFAIIRVESPCLKMPPPACCRFVLDAPDPFPEAEWSVAGVNWGASRRTIRNRPLDFKSGIEREPNRMPRRFDSSAAGPRNRPASRENRWLIRPNRAFLALSGPELPLPPPRTPTDSGPSAGR